MASSASLSLYNAQVVPKSNTQYGVYANDADFLEIENFTFGDGSEAHHSQSMIYARNSKNDVSLKNIALNFSLQLSRNDYAINLGGSGVTTIQNATIIGSDFSGGGYIRQDSEDVVFKNNILSGGLVQKNAVYISGSNEVVVTNNEVSSTTSSWELIDLSGKNALVSNNYISSTTSSTSLVVLDASYNLTASNNSISDSNAEWSIIDLKGYSILFKENKLLNVGGSTAIKISGNVKVLELTRNALIDPTVKFYMQIESKYGLGPPSGIITIGSNYWPVNSFQVLKNNYT